MDGATVETGMGAETFITTGIGIQFGTASR
jgi:hypothetical protein